MGSSCICTKFMGAGGSSTAAPRPKSLWTKFIHACIGAERGDSRALAHGAGGGAETHHPEPAQNPQIRVSNTPKMDVELKLVGYIGVTAGTAPGRNRPIQALSGHHRARICRNVLVLSVLCVSF